MVSLAEDEARTVGDWPLLTDIESHTNTGGAQDAGTN